MTRPEHLIRWVADKYRTRPYFDHCLTVARLAAPAAALAWETGLCHYMVEDELTTPEELQTALRQFRYDDQEIRQILTAVKELTDVFTPEAFPDLSKKQRRKLESARLAGTGRLAQTVKYADLIANGVWIRQHRPEKWERYQKRKCKLLLKLDRGEPSLRQAAWQSFGQ